MLRAPIRAGRCRRQSPGESEEPLRPALRHCQESPVPPGQARDTALGCHRLPGAAHVLLRRCLPVPGGLCSAQASARLQWGSPGRSPAGAGRVEALRPLLPRESRGPSHPSVRSDRSFAKFLPDTFPPSPERGEPAVAVVRPAALPSPCPLPPPLSGRRDSGRAAAPVPSRMVMFQG